MKKISCVLLSLFVSAVWIMGSADKLTYLCDEWNIMSIVIQNGNVVVPSGGNVTFQAEKKVTLKPGFKVNLGGKFHAKVNALPVPNYVRKNFSDTGGDYMPLFDNTSWIKVRHNSGDLRVWADIYTNAGDSIFEGKKYRVIKEREIYVDEPTLNPQEWIYLFYEDLENKRTYVYDDFRQKDRLLYDFSVRVGDRLPSDEDSNFILKDISTMDNSGHTRKQYTFVHESDTIVWLEGIGNCNDFTRPYFRKHDGVKMLCVQKENETIYDTSTTEEKSCDDINQIYENLLVHEDITDIYIDNSPSATKILRDGQIFILRGDKTYTLQGQEVK